MNQMLTSEMKLDTNQTKISAKDVDVYYGEAHAIKSVNVEIPDKMVTAFIGPSGCGKSTFLRCINRMNDTIDVCRVEGNITLDGEDIYDKRVDPVQLRAKLEWFFKNQIRFQNRSMTMSHMGPASTVWQMTNPRWTRS